MHFLTTSSEPLVFPGTSWQIAVEPIYTLYPALCGARHHTDPVQGFISQRTETEAQTLGNSPEVS